MADLLTCICLLMVLFLPVILMIHIVPIFPLDNRLLLFLPLCFSMAVFGIFLAIYGLFIFSETRKKTPRFQVIHFNGVENDLNLYGYLEISP